VRIWSRDTRADGVQYYPPLARRARHITISFDGKYFVASCQDGAVYWFDTMTHALAKTDRTYPDSEPKLRFSQDGTLIAARFADGRTVVRKRGETRDYLTLAGTSEYGTFCWAPDNKRLATTIAPRTAVIVDVASGRVLHRFNSQSVILEMAFSPDGRQFVLVNERLLTYDAQTMQAIFDLDQGGPCYSADSQILVTEWGGEARAYEARTGRLLHKFTTEASHIDVALSPDGKTLATRADDVPEIMLWDVRTGQELLSIAPPGPIVHAMLFSPSGDRLFASGEDKNGQDHIWEWAISKK
jgi:WD40 repeat protein